MALQKQVVSVPFTQGVDTKTDAKLVIPGKLSRAENLMLVGGTLARRPGGPTLTSVIDAGGSFTSAGALFGYDNELATIIAGKTYGYGQDIGKWVTKPGGAHYATLANTRLQRGTRTQWAADQASLNGVTMFAWSEPAAPQQGVHVAVYDENTGNFYQTGSSALASTTTGACVRVLAIGNNLVLVFQDTTAGKLFTAFVSTSAPEVVPTPVAIRTDLVTGGAITCFFDAIAYSAALGMAVYLTSTAGATIGLFFDQTGTVTTVGGVGPTSITIIPTTSTPSIIVFAIQRDTAGNTYVVVGVSGAGGTTTRTSIAVFSSTWVTTLAPVSISSASPPTQISLLESSTNLITCFFGSGSSALGMSTATINSAGIVSAFAAIPGAVEVRLVSDAFLFDGVAAVGVVSRGSVSFVGQTSASTQPTLWVIDAAGNPIARALSGLAADNAGDSVIPGGSNFYAVPGRLSKAITSLTKTVSLLAYERGRLAFASALYGQPIDVTPVGLTRVALTPVSPATLPILRVGSTEYIGGALPRLYDGQQVAEAGLPVPPLQPTAGSAGSGSLSAGTYQLRALFSWVDAKGQLVRSPPSPPLSFTVSASANQPVTLYPCPLSSRDLLPQGATVQIEVERTTANGTVFYRDSSPSAPIFSVTTGTVAYTTTQSDTALQVGELLYTTGGTYDWLAPPAYKAACVFKQRLIVTGLEDPFETRVSSVVRNGEALRFNEAWSIRVPTSTGPMVTVAALDDKLILFTTGAAYYVIGDGPDLLGNNPYGQPQLITSVTSGSQSAIAGSFPDGVIFQGAEGLMLLDRGLGCQYFGQDVEAFGKMTVRAMTLVPAKRQVRIQVDNGSDIAGQLNGLYPVQSDGGYCLVWDYQYSQWLVWPNYGAQAACLAPGNAYTRLRSDGVLFQEAVGSYSDSLTPYSWVAETAWLKFAGIQGFQRVYRALLEGNYNSDATLTLEIAYDYSGNGGTPTYDPADATILTGSGIYTAGQPFQLEHHLRVQKCEAVKFRITETAAGGGAGISITDLSLLVGIKPTQFKKLPAAKRT